jgi:hypothetical protein
VGGEILARHATGGCSNGPTEALNLLVKKVKRVGHGIRNFANYRLRLLVRCGVRRQLTEPQDCEGAHHVGRVGPANDADQRKVERAMRNPTSSIRKVGWLRRRTEARQPQRSSNHPPPRSTR